ncbi:MAG: alpha/beta hydrolase family protein [Pirellula sp.]|jgi:pimeloyl-ACP methyl ester carboxylesterase|nr:prolyl oligopeptidase family serine peptidase [Pirellula sp.]
MKQVIKSCCYAGGYMVGVLGLLWLVFECQALGQTNAKIAPAPKTRIELPGEKLTIQDRPAFLFLPDPSKRTSPQPWIFYAPTLAPYPDDAERWMHTQFLDAGVAVAGIDVGEAYGSPKSHDAFNALYSELTEKRSFAKKLCLFGRSRGGLWVSSWALAYPERITGVIGIYPVYDFKTYPKLDKAAPAYGFTAAELESRSAEFNPIERIEKLAKAKIPFTIIHGNQDTVVPLTENSQELLRRYKAVGQEGLVQLIVADGQGHNMWEGFFREPKLVEFAIEAAKRGAK